MKISFTPIIGVIILMLGMASVGHAHRFYASFTQMDLNDDKKTIEITHRLVTHDVDDFLRREADHVADLTLAKRNYYLQKLVESDFALFDKNGAKIPLTWIWADYKADMVQIYQEAPLPSDPSDITIINRLFMNLFSDQKNTVNVEWNKKIRTRIFVKGNQQQKVDFNIPD
ncbi:MAG: hypothetical protein K9G26_10530 [Emcibacter sp.]|nr:hypothetical protein [Emcibacter sp.]